MFDIFNGLDNTEASNNLKNHYEGLLGQSFDTADDPAKTKAFLAFNQQLQSGNKALFDLLRQVDDVTQEPASALIQYVRNTLHKCYEDAKTVKDVHRIANYFYRDDARIDFDCKKGWTPTCCDKPTATMLTRKDMSDGAKILADIQYGLGVEPAGNSLNTVNHPDLESGTVGAPETPRRSFLPCGS